MARVVSRLCALVAAPALLAPALPTQPAQEPAPLRGVRRAAWNDAAGELLLLCDEPGGSRLRRFDPWLRELEPGDPARMPAAGAAPGADGALECPLWPGRRLRLEPDGAMRVLPAWWETSPRLRWGPGWAAVELRNGRPLAALAWRRAGDAELHTEAFSCDRFDGAAQRAFLRGIDAGERIEIALPALQPEFPPRSGPRWAAFTVPAVDPDGGRPTSAWPSE